MNYSQGFKVLIVEDEILIARELKHSLLELGYDVQGIAKNFTEAMAFLETDDTDVALIDITLRGTKTGIDLGTYLLEVDEIPFIYLTSHSDKLTIDKAKATRPAAYLVKPFKKETIYSTLEIALNNFAHRNIDTKRSVKKSDIQVPYKIRKVVNYINKYDEERPTLNQMAAIADMSVYHFARSFKSQLGISPYKYLVNCKIERAKAMLTETEENVIQICFAVGYENHSHFSQIFKKNVGVSPELFRRQNTTGI